MITRVRLFVMTALANLAKPRQPGEADNDSVENKLC